MAAPLLMMVVLARVAALAVSFEPGAMTVSVPVRGGTAGAPEVRMQPGEVTVEVPEGRVERQSTTLLPPAGRVAEIAEVSAQTSRSHHRAVVTLRLRAGVALPRERLEAVLQEGVLTLVVHEAGASSRTLTRPPSAGAQAGARAGGHEAKPEPVKLAKAEPAKPAQAESAQPEDGSTVPLARSRPHEGTVGVRAEAPARPISEQWPRLAGALCLLGLAAWLAIIYMRKHRQGPRETRSSAIDIVASRMVGGKQRLLVVDVEQQRFLLSASDNGGVQLLSSIGEGPDRSVPEVPRAAATVDDPLENVFSDMLDNVHKTPPAPRSIEARAAELRPDPQPEQQSRPAQPARPMVQVSDREARSAAVIDREARSAAVIDREARSAAVSDREARSAAVSDREARSAAVSDREARSAAVSDREARSAAVSEETEAEQHELRQIKQAHQPRQRATLLDLKPGGTDVSGLLALRRNRTGAGPC